MNDQEKKSEKIEPTEKEAKKAKSEETFQRARKVVREHLKKLAEEQREYFQLTSGKNNSSKQPVHKSKKD
jgi:hypothetical protein